MSEHEEAKPARLVDQLKVWPQHLFSLRWFSLPMYHLSRLSLGGKVTPWLIRQYVKRFDVDMSEARPENIEEYSSFNEFFTRAIDLAARPIAEKGVISPVDGTVSQVGRVEHGEMLQAKGQYFTLNDLFGRVNRLSRLFQNGVYCTLYLSPGDYHRIHIPAKARPQEMIYVPGRLFSVNPTTTRLVSRVYARNERVVTVFKSEAGPMAVVMVGAFFVGSLETTWQGMITPSPEFKKIETWRTPEVVPVLEKGEEMGRFNLGSTVILLFEADRVSWLPEIQPGTKVQMGQALGTMLKAKPSAKQQPKPKAPPPAGKG